MKPLFTLFFAALFLGLNAQKTFQKAIGTTADEVARWVELGNEPNTYVVCGTNATDGTGIVMKIDGAGEVVWSKKIKELGAVSCTGIVRSNLETGYLVYGANTDVGIFVIKLDENGQIVWKKSFPGTQLPRGITKLSSGYAITGSSSDGFYMYIGKLKEDGTLEWSHFTAASSFSIAYGVLEMADESLLCFGATDGQGSVTLFDKNGVIIDSQFVGGTGTEAVYHATWCANGDFVCGDHTWSFPSGFYNYDLWMNRFAPDGTLIWSKTYASKDGVTRGAVRPCVDNGLILSPTDYTTNDNDGHLIKTDADGNVEWAKSYGEAGNDRLFCAVECIEGGFFAVGSTESFGAGSNDFFFVKTNADGTIGQGLGCTVQDYEVIVTEVLPDFGTLSAIDGGSLSAIANSASATNFALANSNLCEALPALDALAQPAEVANVKVFDQLGRLAIESAPIVDGQSFLNEKLPPGGYFFSQYDRFGQLIDTKKIIVFSKN